jgi:hypothetical protein
LRGSDVAKNEKKMQPEKPEDLNDTLKQYVLSIPIGHLNRLRIISDESQRSVQSLLREGVEMLLRKHERRVQKKESEPRAAGA